MTARQAFGRKARWWILLLIALVLVAALIAGRSCTARDSVPGANLKDVRVVDVGKDMMVLQPESIERQLNDWLESGSKRTFDFELGAQTFAPGSTQLSRSGEERLIRLATLMKKHNSTKLHILMPTGVEGPDGLALQKQRADQLRVKLIGQDIDPSRVTVEQRDQSQLPAEDSRLVVLVSK